MSNFCLKQCQGLNAMVAYLYPNVSVSALPPHPPALLSPIFISLTMFLALQVPISTGKFSHVIDLHLFHEGLFKRI